MRGLRVSLVRVGLFRIVTLTLEGGFVLRRGRCGTVFAARIRAAVLEDGLRGDRLAMLLVDDCGTVLVGGFHACIRLVLSRLPRSRVESRCVAGYFFVRTS